MAEISQDLLNFRDSVKPGLGSMESYCSIICNKLQELTNSCTSAINGISSNYKGKNQAEILESLNSLGEEVVYLSSNIESELSTYVSDSKKLCSSIDSLDELKTTIDGLEAKANAIVDENDNIAISNKNSAKYQLSQKMSEFNEKLSNALNELSGIKGKDSSLNVGNETLGNKELDALYDLYKRSDLKFGSFDYEYYDVNGYKIKCLVYKPKYTKETGKLPVMLYMHGASMEDTGESIMTYGGFGEMLNNKEVTPSGIVVIPYVRNGWLYEDENFRDALAELPKKVAEENNGDKDRISVAGVSYGGITAHLLVTEHPGEFSAVVSACGASEVTDAYKDLTVLNFCGQGESSKRTALSYVTRQTEAINKVGGNAKLIVYDNQWAHTNVGTKAFHETITNENGEEIPIFEYMFQQVRNKKA